MEPQRQHIPFLDHMRGVAILLVFLCHGTLSPLEFTGRHSWMVFDGAWNLYLSDSPLRFLMTAFIQGWVGVPIFFVISGFCIHLSFQRSQGKSWTDFFIRRFFRIYPPYLVALLFFALILPYSRLHLGSTHQEPGGLARAFRELSAHIFLVHEFGNFDVNPPFWSVAAEVKLYILYPVLIWLSLRLGWKKTVWITALIEFSLRSAQVLHGLKLSPLDLTWVLYRESPLYFWYSWSIGAWMAQCFLKGDPLPFRKLPILPCLGIFLVCDITHGLILFCFPLASIITARVVGMLLVRKQPESSSSPWKQWILDHLREVGVVSYSIYLLHYPLQDQIFILLRDAAPQLFDKDLFTLSLMFLLLIPMWFLIFYWSKSFHRFVEVTSIALGNRIIKSRRAMADRATTG